MSDSARIQFLQTPRSFEIRQVGENATNAHTDRSSKNCCSCKCCLCATVACISCVVLVIFYVLTGEGTLAFLRPARPALIGPYSLGSIRARLPPAQAHAAPGLFVQVWYPTDEESPMLDVESFQWIRPEVRTRIAQMTGFPAHIAAALVGGQKQFDPPSAPKALPEDSAGWPLVIFSSGILGSIEMYTLICQQLASFGAIVIALDYEDGSGVFATDGATGEVVEFTPHPNYSISGDEFRRPFLQQRMRELNASIHSILSTAQSLSSHSEGAIAEVLKTGDAKTLILVGHSFGATTVVRYLQVSKTLPAPQGVMLLDLWTGPLEDVTGVRVPFLFMLSEMFVLGGQVQNFRDFLSANAGQSVAAVSVNGTVHQWVSDAELFAPQYLLQPLGVTGPGEYFAYIDATSRVLKLCFDAFLHAERSSLQKQAIEVNPQIITPFA